VLLLSARKLQSSVLLLQVPTGNHALECLGCGDDRLQNLRKDIARGKQLAQDEKGSAKIASCVQVASGQL